MGVSGSIDPLVLGWTTGASHPSLGPWWFSPALCAEEEPSFRGTQGISLSGWNSAGGSHIVVDAVATSFFCCKQQPLTAAHPVFSVASHANSEGLLLLQGLTAQYFMSLLKQRFTILGTSKQPECEGCFKLSCDSLFQGMSLSPVPVLSHLIWL